MDDWTNELRGIDTDFRNRIENAIRDLEREETERHLMEQQEIEMRKAIAREKREKRRLEKKSTLMWMIQSPRLIKILKSSDCR